MIKQKYILAPGAKGAELLNTAAACGVSTFNVRVVSDVELCEMALLARGVMPPTNIISEGEALQIFARVLLGGGTSDAGGVEKTDDFKRDANKADGAVLEYFSTATYSDIVNIMRSIEMLRVHMPTDETSGFNAFCAEAEFTEKNEAIYAVYKAYRRELERRRLIDKIDFVRGVIEEFSVKDCAKLVTEILLFEEFPLTPLQNELVNALFDMDAIQKKSLFEIFAENKISERDIKITFASAYGASNEVEHVFGTIAGGDQETEGNANTPTKLPLDTCTIAVSNTTTYTQLIYDFCVQHNVPATFGCGLPVTLSNAAACLLNMHEWSTTGIFGKDALSKMVLHESFDTQKLCEAIGIAGLKDAGDNAEQDLPSKESASEQDWPLVYEKLDTILDLAGSLRLSFDAERNSQKLQAYKKSGYEYPQHFGHKIVDNQIFEATQRFAREIKNGPLYLLAEYTASSNFINLSEWRAELTVTLNASAKNKIISHLQTYIDIFGEQNFADGVPYALQQTVASQQRKPGFLHVDTLGGTHSTMRKNTFIVGLSADKFPGSPRENYLVLDSDLEILASHYALNGMPTSAHLVEQKSQSLLALVKNASKAGAKLSVSWPHFNTCDLKELNPSSAVYEIWRQATGSEAVDFKVFDAEVEKVGFFEHCFDSDFAYKQAFRDGKVFAAPESEAPESEAPESEAPESEAPESEAPSQPSKETASEASSASTTKATNHKIKISPSKAATMYVCPLAFYLESLIGLADTQEDDQHKALPAMDNGSMVHKCMEQFCAQTPPTKDDFINYGQHLLDSFLAYRPAYFADGEQDAREDFTELLEAAYDQNQAFAGKPVEAEKFLSSQIDGFEVRGFVDRIEAAEDGTTRIVDFKTGRTITHSPDDPASCIQGLLYAYILAHDTASRANANKISAEFRYPRKFNDAQPARANSCITCDYNAADVEDYFSELKQRIAEWEFSPSVEPDKRERECKYCSFRAICDREIFVTDDEEDCAETSAAKARINSNDIAGSFTAEDAAQASSNAQLGGDE